MSEQSERVQRPRGRKLPHLTAWREYRIMSGVELAHKADIGRSTIHRAETGQEIVSWLNIRKLAKALEITPEQLINEDPPTHRVAGAA
jgi:transcriptional regulator with XRE-family HTH domain